MTERAKQGALFTPEELVQLHGESIEELRSGLGRTLERLGAIEQHVADLESERARLLETIDATSGENDKGEGHEIDEGDLIAAVMLDAIDAKQAHDAHLAEGATRARPRPGASGLRVQLEALVAEWRRRAACGDVLDGEGADLDRCADELAVLLEGQE